MKVSKLLPFGFRNHLNQDESTQDDRGKSIFSTNLHSNREKKQLITSALILLVLLISAGGLVFGSRVYQSLENRSQADGGWPGEVTDWSVRNKIVLTNAYSSGVANNVVRVRLDNSKIDLSKIKTISELRFFDSAGTKLSYWIEQDSLNPDNPPIGFVDAYVRLNSDPNFYVYYGYTKSDVPVSESNGDQTFDYFEDFENIKLNAWFGVITDLQHDTNSLMQWRNPDFSMGDLGGPNGLVRLQKFVGVMNQYNMNFIIDLGDKIHSELGHGADVADMGVSLDNQEEALKALIEYESVFSTFKNKRYYVNNNHEFWTLSPAEVASTLGGQGAVGSQVGDKSNFVHSFVQGGVRFIILDVEYVPPGNPWPPSTTGGTVLNDGTFPKGFNAAHRGPDNHRPGQGYIPSAELNWIRGELQRAKSGHEKVVIFSSNRLDTLDYLTSEECNNQVNHDGQISLANYCTDSRNSSNLGNLAKYCSDFYVYRNVVNFPEVQQLLEEYSEVVIGTFSGHDHMNSNTIINGLNYRNLDAADNAINPYSQPAFDSTIKYNENFVPKQPATVYDMPNHYVMAVNADRGLVQIQARGSETNNYDQTYSGGKLLLASNINNFNLPAMLPLGKIKGQLSGNLMTGAVLETYDGTNAGVGFWDNLDHEKITHRCSNQVPSSINPAGRDRFSNAYGTVYYGNSSQVYGYGNKYGQENSGSPSLVAKGGKKVLFSSKIGSTISHALVNNSDVVENISQRTTINGSPNLSPGIWQMTRSNQNSSGKVAVDAFFVNQTRGPEMLLAKIESKELKGGGTVTPPVTSPTLPPSAPTPTNGPASAKDTQVEIYAKGSRALKPDGSYQYPDLMLLVDRPGTTDDFSQKITIDSLTGFEKYSVVVPGKIGPDQLTLTFSNDYYNSQASAGQRDVNVAVQKVIISGYNPIIMLDRVVYAKGSYNAPVYSTSTGQPTGGLTKCGGRELVKTEWLFCNGFIEFPGLTQAELSALGGGSVPSPTPTTNTNTPKPTAITEPNKPTPTLANTSQVQIGVWALGTQARNTSNTLVKPLMRLVVDRPAGQADTYSTKTVTHTESTGVGEYLFTVAGPVEPSWVKVEFINDYYNSNAPTGYKDVNLKIEKIKVGSTEYQIRDLLFMTKGTYQVDIYNSANGQPTGAKTDCGKNNVPALVSSEWMLCWGYLQLPGFAKGSAPTPTTKSNVPNTPIPTQKTTVPTTAPAVKSDLNLKIEQVSACSSSGGRIYVTAWVTNKYSYKKSIQLTGLAYNQSGSSQINLISSDTNAQVNGNTTRQIVRWNIPGFKSQDRWEVQLKDGGVIVGQVSGLINCKIN